MAIENITEQQLRESLKQRLIDGSITKEQASKAVMEFRKAKTPEGGLVDAVWEPVKAIAGGMAGQVASGYAGMFKLATGQGINEAADTVEAVQKDTAELVQPETVIGRESIQNVSDLIELGVDAARVPISGIAGIAELIAGQGLEQANKTIESINTRGVSATAGDRAFEETGSPLLATLAYMSPEIIATAIPVAGKAKQVSKFQKNVANRLRNSQANEGFSKQAAQLSAGIKGDVDNALLLKMFDDLTMNAPQKMKGRLAMIADDLEAGVNPNKIARQLDDISKQALVPTAETDLVRYMKNGLGEIKSDRLAKDAIKQGFDEGIVASVKASTSKDKSKMLGMLDVYNKGKKDPLFAVNNRPTDIAGDSLLERVKHLKTVNQQAGKQLDDVAKSLKGKEVEFKGVVDDFVTRLDDMGVQLDGNLNPVFRGSDIEGATAAENIIGKVISRMKTKGTPDAYELHRMKKFIDEQVTYGKLGEGLSGKAEGLVKKLRKDIDDVLDTNFSEYNKVNTTYADTVGALDSLQDAAGKKMDLFGPNADKATGTLLRRMMSNAQSRINLSDAVDDLEMVARKYGGEFDDNIKMQMLFADELDSMMGAVARTGFQRSIGEGTKYGIEAATGQKTAVGVLGDAAANLANKARGISEEGAINSMKLLLERK